MMGPRTSWLNVATQSIGMTLYATPTDHHCVAALPLSMWSHQFVEMGICSTPNGDGFVPQTHSYATNVLKAG